MNNTEAVYIQNPAAGTWTIRVTWTQRAAAARYQPFALFVSGGLGVTPSWTRTCSGIAGSCTGTARAPRRRPTTLRSSRFTGTESTCQAGGSFTTSFRLTNWGANSDTISLSSPSRT